MKVAPMGDGNYRKRKERGNVKKKKTEYEVGEKGEIRNPANKGNRDKEKRGEIKEKDKVMREREREKGDIKHLKILGKRGIKEKFEVRKCIQNIAGIN